MSKKTLLDELKKEHDEAYELFQQMVQDGESETVRRVALTMSNTYKHCIRLVNKHLNSGSIYRKYRKANQRSKQ